MRTAHGCDKKSMVVCSRVQSYDPRMQETTLAYPTGIAETRAMTLVLSESEWRALKAIEPDAIGWLQRQISNRIATQGERAVRAAAQAADVSHNDEY